MDHVNGTGDDPSHLESRTTREVFEDHLRLRREGRLDEDLRRNYGEDIVLLTVNSLLHGHEAIRRSAERLHLQLPAAEFEFTAKQVSGEYAFLVWRASSTRFRVECGADSFLIRGGKIRMQTIHYRLLPTGCG